MCNCSGKIIEPKSIRTFEQKPIQQHKQKLKSNPNSILRLKSDINEINTLNNRKKILLNATQINNLWRIRSKQHMNIRRKWQRNRI